MGFEILSVVRKDEVMTKKTTVSKNAQMVIVRALQRLGRLIFSGDEARGDGAA